jgi:hypothetical protein
MLRTETVLSRFPIHTLTTCGRVTIEAQTAQATTRERCHIECSLVWQSQCTQLQPALPCAALGTLAVTQWTRLVTAGTSVWTRGLAGRVALDETLETQAGLPACETWQQMQEDA